MTSDSCKNVDVTWSLSSPLSRAVSRYLRAVGQSARELRELGKDEDEDGVGGGGGDGGGGGG